MQVNFDVTPLTLDVPISSTEGGYFSYDVATNESGISVLLTNLNGNVDLITTQLRSPIWAAMTMAASTAGASDENIIIYTNSEPVLARGRHWYSGCSIATSPTSIIQS